MDDVLKQNQSSLEPLTIFDKFLYCLKYVAVDIVIVIIQKRALLVVSRVKSPHASLDINTTSNY